ncbi:MAG: acyltransferase family protein [Myxococcales bacterium]
MNHGTHASYRPDIDGLRAIAVLSVLAFHVSGKLLPGGFVGVDIFFVISGFLITGLLTKAMDGGTFSFASFYTRRLKRILPVYIVVALATLLVSSWLLIPADYILYTTSLAASWLFAANIFFSMLSLGYFGQRTEEFPLLHTWSLSVEEQFYFVFPILLLVLFRFSRRRAPWLLLALGVGFTVLSQSMTEHVRSYFLLSSRAQELIIGALTVFVVRARPVESRRLATGMAVAGMALVVGSLVLIDRFTPFPGINSLYPCLGVALLIYAGGRDHVLTPVLKSRPLVFVGLISYSLYLWHWPLLAFLRYRYVDVGLAAKTLAIAFAFVLAWLTWKYVESPIREDRSLDFRRAFLRFYLAPTAAFLSVGAFSYFTAGAPQRFPSDLRQLMASYSTERNLSHACSIRSSDYQPVTVEYLVANCALGDLSQQKVGLLLMGDSHANHFKPFLEQMATEARLKMVFHVQGSCLPTDLYETATPRPDAPTTCQRHNLNLVALADKAKFVALGGNWTTVVDPHFETKLDALVGKISRAGAIPLILKDNPSYEPDLSHCILAKRRGWRSADTNCNIPSAAARAQAEVDAAIDHVAARHLGAVVIDPKVVMCNATECATSLDNIAVYRDSHHINPPAAVLLGQKYIGLKGNPLATAQGLGPTQTTGERHSDRDGRAASGSEHPAAAP